MNKVIIVLVGGLVLGAVSFLLAQPESPAEIAAAPPISVTTTAPAPATTPITTTPTTTTTTTPPTTTTTEPRGSLVIHGVGDVNTDTSYIPALATEGHRYAWSGLGDLFVDDDLTVINLECTPSDLGEPLPKEFVFRCDSDSLAPMREAGVEVANLGNNHSQDHGPEAMLDGKGRLAVAGILPVGVGASATEAAQPALIEVNGWKVAVVGFGGVVPNAGWLATDTQPGMADGDTIETMAATVAAASESADLVVVSIHWGWELELEPRDDDRARAEAMIAAGADIIFGHHPHRLQPLEVVDGKPVAWSLGNFVWPNWSVPGSTTAVARVEVAPDGTMVSCLIPAYISAPGRPELRGDPRC